MDGPTGFNLRYKTPAGEVVIVRLQGLPRDLAVLEYIRLRDVLDEYGFQELQLWRSGIKVSPPR